MQILCQPLGPYQTNCYIVSHKGRDIIIDPGVDALKWVMSKVKNPLAILNTHGHSDHIWSNKILRDVFSIPIYCPQDDSFMLINDFDNEGYSLCSPDIEIIKNEFFNLAGVNIQYLHFPGHTPGCSAIIIEKAFFSGDFIFKGSIGSVDFPFSSPNDMKNSIEDFLALKEEMTVYPGHGFTTTIRTEQKTIGQGLKVL